MKYVKKCIFVQFNEALWTVITRSFCDKRLDFLHFAKDNFAIRRVVCCTIAILQLLTIRQHFDLAG